MNRKLTTQTIFAIATLVIGCALAFAHNGIEHVMGTVTAITDTSITVQTPKHTAVTVMLGSATTFTHKDVKATVKDLKVGERVVINAKEGADQKLLGISVKWGAGADTASGHAAHKM
jgi:hypothetical protein